MTFSWYFRSIRGVSENGAKQLQKQPRKLGRPSKFTENTQKLIIENIELGMPITRAAQAAGVGPSTISSWMADTRPRFAKFQQAVQQAMPAAERSLLASVRNHAIDDGHLAMKLLAGMHPERYSAYRGKNGSSVTLREGERSVSVTGLPEDAAASILDALRSYTSGAPGGGDADQGVHERPAIGGPGGVRSKPGDHT